MKIHKRNENKNKTKKRKERKTAHVMGLTVKMQKTKDTEVTKHDKY
jgi:hypothetical protein